MVCGCEKDWCEVDGQVSGGDGIAGCGIGQEHETTKDGDEQVKLQPTTKLDSIGDGLSGWREVVRGLVKFNDWRVNDYLSREDGDELHTGKVVELWKLSKLLEAYLRNGALLSK